MILVVDGQRIYNYEYQEPPPIATNSLGFIDIEFRLSEEWNGHICTAQFVQHKENGTDFIASKVLYNNHVTFPDGIIPGVLEISLFGYKAGEAERGTTFPYLQPVYRSGFTSTEETPIPPTPDLYAQLLEKFKQQGVSEEVIAEAVKDYLDKNPVQIEESDPTISDWAKQPNKPSYTAQEVGADPSGTASSQIATHNTNTSAHADIRTLISNLTNRLNALADSDDTTLDQMSEIVAYIKSNKTLIDAVTTGKVSVSDIVDNLTTNASGKVLSAAQGVKLKAMIDGIIVPDKLPNPQPLTINGQSYDGSVPVSISLEGTGTSGEDGGYYVPSVDSYGNLSWQASKEDMPSVPGTNIKGPAGKDGKDGTSVTHNWDGTVLTVTSASGTSSADLKGPAGANGYTPVRGTDYWTQADQEQIVADVLAALPNASGVSF